MLTFAASRLGRSAISVAGARSVFVGQQLWEYPRPRGTLGGREFGRPASVEDDKQTFYCINTALPPVELYCNCNYCKYRRYTSRTLGHRFRSIILNPARMITGTMSMCSRRSTTYKQETTLTNGMKDDSETLDTSGWCSSGVFERLVCVIFSREQSQAREQGQFWHNSRCRCRCRLSRLHHHLCRGGRHCRPCLLLLLLPWRPARGARRERPVLHRVRS